MLQPLQPVEGLASVSNAQPAPDSKRADGPNHLKTPFRLLTGLFVSPLLLLLAVFGFFAVLGDFAWFRLRGVRDGHPHPKGLWEF